MKNDPQLPDNGKLFMHAMENTPNAVCITDASNPALPILYVNPAFSKITGYSAEECLGRNCRFLQGKDTSRAAVNLIRESISNQEAVSIEILNYRKDGSPFWNELRISPVFAENGTLTHYIGFQNDVTARKKAGWELAEALEFRRNIMEAIPDLIYFMDLQGTLIDTNRNSGLQGRPIHEYVPSPLHAAITEMLDKAKRKEKSEIELPFLQEDGSYRLYSWSAIPLTNALGKVIGITGLGRDISERERVQKDLRAASNIQQRLLPPPIDHERLQVRTIFKANQYVSGDLYDYRWDTERQRFSGFLVDIMGHGVATAMQASAFKLLFRGLFDEGQSIEETLNTVNQACLELFPEEYIASALCFELDLANGRLKYVSAGIHQFYHLTAEGARLLKVPGEFLGMFDHLKFQLQEIPFGPGDSFIFLSDGLYDNLEDCCERNNPESLHEAMRCLEQLANQPDIKDDATAIGIWVKP